MKLTVRDIRASRIPQVLNVAPTDPRLLQWLNEGEEVLMHRGKWYGTMAKVVICVTDGCLTWPREVADISGIKVCGRAGKLKNQWYEFTEFLSPYADECDSFCHDTRLEDRGFRATTSDISGTGKKIIGYCNPADNGKRVLIQGRDGNNQWIRTVDAGAVVDGEYLELSNTGAVTVNYFDGGVTGIQKEVTQYDVLLFQQTPGSATPDHLIGQYQPDETNPSFRQSIVKGLGTGGTGCCSSGCSTLIMIEALCLLQHIDVREDNDWLVIQSVVALSHAALSRKLREDGKYAESETELAQAIRELRHQNRTMTGDRTTVIATGHGSAYPSRVFRGFR